jgi:hypothetical protein
MRYGLLVSLLLLGAPVIASMQVSIGISLGSYPQFVTVPGYPVYYAPGVNLNFFFYDGLYWVYQDDRWYSSEWYDGPWDLVDPMYVPYYVLQVPVRYYRRPPAYFRGWQADRAPHWGEHWGHDWEQRRQGWDRPLRQIAPAPLPDYQRQYRGNTYPRGDQQRALRDQNYHYRTQQPPPQQQRPQVEQRPQPRQQQPIPRPAPNASSQPQQPRQAPLQQQPQQQRAQMEQRQPPRQEQPRQAQRQPAPAARANATPRQQPRQSDRPAASAQPGQQGDRGQKDQKGNDRQNQTDKQDQRGRDR